MGDHAKHPSIMQWMVLSLIHLLRLKRFMKLKRRINLMEEEIINYLVKLSNASLSLDQRETN